MAQKLTGLKIRARRKELGLTQADLARHAGISAPYLNLIEGNRRPVGAALLKRISAELNVDVAQLDGGAERRLVQALEELAADPRFADPNSTRGNAEDLVGRHPGWSELILGLFRAYEDQRQAVLALADRLNHDPFLGENVHQMLTNATSLSSAAEILAGGSLSEKEQRRFGAIVQSDVARLSATARALLGFFDSAEMRVRSATPSEHVDAFILQENNHFPTLEALAKDYLQAPSRDGFRDVSPMTDAPDDTPETQRFALAKRTARRIGSEAVGEIVHGHSALPSEDSRRLAEAAIYSYLAGAILMPYEPFLEAAERHRYDIDALCRRFGVSYEQAAHRLATLRRPGAEGVQLAFMRSDVSGHVTKRLPLPGLPLPRYTTACSLWAIYSAFQTPGITVRQYGELPSGDRFLFFARAVDKMPARIGYPRKLLSVMMACPANEVGRVVYGDGLDLEKAAVSIGTVCRLCRREDCGYRQEEQLIAGPALSDKRRMSDANHS
ncbi:helix-turn-helix domain-containing protein [Nitratireductor luteus]|uniref:helix-turn-helix domain-containing protein n=1 Tax=Nitratireductor luteus TaxID=2976980 RepID=UPI00223EF7B8|nr:XRE family transcriptional regulator [Nitratireductor luteus]